MRLVAVRSKDASNAAWRATSASGGFRICGLGFRVKTSFEYRFRFLGSWMYSKSRS